MVYRKILMSAVVLSCFCSTAQCSESMREKEWQYLVSKNHTQDLNEHSNLLSSEVEKSFSKYNRGCIKCSELFKSHEEINEKSSSKKPKDYSYQSHSNSSYSPDPYGLIMPIIATTAVASPAIILGVSVAHSGGTEKTAIVGGGAIGVAGGLGLAAMGVTATVLAPVTLCAAGAASVSYGSYKLYNYFYSDTSNQEN